MGHNNVTKEQNPNGNSRILYEEIREGPEYYERAAIPGQQTCGASSSSRGGQLNNGRIVARPVRHESSG